MDARMALVRRGPSKRERPLEHGLARWLLLFGKRRQLRNHVGVDSAAANFVVSLFQ